MRWQFWRQALPQKLSDVVLKSLLIQFPIDAQLADRIRFLGRSGRFSGRPSQYIRIFDPTLIGDRIGDRDTLAPTYDDFSENQHHRGALLFEGRTEKVYENVQVYLTDRRLA